MQLNGNKNEVVNTLACTQSASQIKKRSKDMKWNGIEQYALYTCTRAHTGVCVFWYYWAYTQNELSWMPQSYYCIQTQLIDIWIWCRTLIHFVIVGVRNVYNKIRKINKFTYRHNWSYQRSIRPKIYRTNNKTQSNQCKIYRVWTNSNPLFPGSTYSKIQFTFTLWTLEKVSGAVWNDMLKMI